MAALPLILFLHHAGNVLLLAVKLCQRPQIRASLTRLNYCGVCVLKIAECAFDILISVKTQTSKGEDIPSVILVMLQVAHLLMALCKRTHLTEA